MSTVVTAAEFETVVLSSEAPVLVDFYAPWCKPCQSLMPVLEQVEAATGVPVVKVNIDDEVRLAQTYGVRSIPTLILFKGGEIVGQKTGTQPGAALTQWLNESK